MNPTTDRSYSASEKMINLISGNYELLEVISRFGIPLGFADKNVHEVCEDNGIDTDTFLAVVRFIECGTAPIDPDSDISVESLLIYLRNSHSYFLNFSLPAIRRKLLDGIMLRSNDISFLILKFFDEYTFEVRTHMNYEEEHVFSYAGRLLDNGQPANETITTYSDHHDQVSSRLGELKNLILKYCPQSADSNLLNAALFDIYRCEKELENHCLIEDHIFIPAIKRLERRCAGK